MYGPVADREAIEFVRSIAAASMVGGEIHLPPVLIQPMASDDVARAVAKVALGAPLMKTIEIGGPEEIRFDEFIREGLRARDDERAVVVDPSARYFGTLLSERSLVPDAGATLGSIRFKDWLSVPANVA